MTTKNQKDQQGQEVTKRRSKATTVRADLSFDLLPDALPNSIPYATPYSPQGDLPFSITINNEEYVRKQTKTEEVLLARDASLGIPFMLDEGSKIVKIYNASMVYIRVRVSGFLWNSHVVQDVHTRGDIVVYMPVSKTIAILKGNLPIKYTDAV